MKILAIDPGSFKSGYVLWNGKKIIKHDKVLNIEIEKLIDKWNVNTDLLVLIEMFQNYGLKANAGKSIFDSCIFIGRVQKLCEIKKFKCALIERKTVVSWHTGKATGNDSKVREALISKYPKGTSKNQGVSYGLKSDEWQAFALASYYTERHPTIILG